MRSLVTNPPPPAPGSTPPPASDATARTNPDAPSAPDPRRLNVHRPPPPRDVPYVPSDEPVVAAMLRFANVTAADVVYDLGCGDGRIVIHAARHYGCRGVGVDIDPQRVQESRENAAKARVADRVRFLCQSFFDTDLRPATVVALYLLPSINVKLRPKLLAELRPGSRIVANHFDMGDWQPDMRAEAHHRTLHQWIVPPWVAGAWRCVVNHADAGTHQRRHHMTLNLTRRYQTVTGTARLGRRDLPIRNGRLFGDEMTFKLVDYQRRQPTLRYCCRVRGSMLRGTCHLDGPDGPAVEWAGVWKAAAAGRGGA
jgi:SAM-dependent methyltransferase